MTKLSEIAVARSRRELSPGKSPLQSSREKNAGDWLFSEDEYFPFDADGFEER